ncbi:MAG: UvrD-helicase domain-containing protein [Candidatus Sericytochromatia bacterium]
MGNQLVSEIKTFSFSSDQEIILNNYEQGFASVLATPGAGKTTIITHLIKNLITESKQKDEIIKGLREENKNLRTKK